ncbi:hypothetical protein PE36_08926 [Moritella sp. PE36]|uniref:hypothetical protein n=1 Tax=Moritella sp. PE36 TaxID=58051 RepID=UPI0001569B5D|nr:hypothetical protein [Moritella sp. PE36]EDM65416.1 hypothetical protein PE36_08926 [Moritella sp. PE36]
MENNRYFNSINSHQYFYPVVTGDTALGAGSILLKGNGVDLVENLKIGAVCS